jgi:hypothetical protein
VDDVTADVVNFTGVTRLDLDPMRVLEAAKGVGLTEVVIVGVDADGNEYFSSSVADGAQANWHLQRAQWRLMQIVDRGMDND